MAKREPGCACHWEEGDSPCPVHGEDEEAMAEREDRMREEAAHCARINATTWAPYYPEDDEP